MEDRYLFKAKRVDNREWVQGYLYGIWKKRYILWGMTNDVPNMIEVDPTTICQCTGLKDKNGKLIWENDIVNAVSSNSVGEPICVDGIVVNVTDYNLMLNLDYSDELECVGNIFDNKELLESEG
nr:MAG TPA: YopX protein [Bacteriophage sp.]